VLAEPELQAATPARVSPAVRNTENRYINRLLIKLLGISKNKVLGQLRRAIEGGPAFPA